MVNHPFRRKVGAAASAAAIASLGLVGLAASPAGAATVGLSCQTNPFQDLSAFGLTQPIAIDADFTETFPSTIDVSGSVSGTTSATFAMPAGLLGLAVGAGVTSIDVINASATVTAVNDDSAATLATFSVTAPNATVIPTAPTPIAYGPSPASFTATGADQDVVSYRVTGVDFTVSMFVPLIAGTMTLGMHCDPTSTTPFASTTILQPSAPVSNDITVDVPLGGTRDITIPSLAYPEIDTVTFQGAEPDGSFVSPHGTFSAPVEVGGSWHTTFTHDAASGDTGTTPDVATYTATNSLGSTDGDISVNVLGNECSTAANGECSLQQIIDLDVVGAELSMEQAGGSVHLVDDTTGGPVVLNGDPQTAIGELNDVTVTNARGDGARWDLTGQVTDFTIENEYAGSGCPSTTPASWDFQCIPGSNLAWAPQAAVAHLQVPGDVADVDAGPAISAADIYNSVPAVVTNGMGTHAQTLCSSEPTISGGTFVCGAGLSLVIPASASAGHYTAVLTLTLA
jgi:hypothetical protein